MSEDSFPIKIIKQLDKWVNNLATPLIPPRIVQEVGKNTRLEFQQHNMQAVIIGKLVRAVSGIRAGLLLAELGYITECASILRMVSDFSVEVSAIAEALIRGGKPPKAIQKFVDQYFIPKADTPEEYAKAEKVRYTAREELIKGEVRLAEGTGIDIDQFRKTRNFLNMSYDAYVHGAYETTMELFNWTRGDFAMSGSPDEEKRVEFAEAVFLKLPEVVSAIELSASVMGHAAVFEETRKVRHEMDASKPWRFDDD